MYMILRRPGRRANGWEADRGKIWHAVAEYEAATGGKSICGVMPSNYWSDTDGSYVGEKQVTCPRCLKQLEAA